MAEEKNKMRFFLSNKIYSIDAVRQAAEDFKEICDCRIVNDKIEIELILKAEIEEPMEDEFCNYVLGLMKNKEMI